MIYVAYGSNMNRVQMMNRCLDAEWIGAGWVHGYRLVFRGPDGKAVASVVPSNGSDLPVAVWEISEDDERALDRYEGYPWFYGKEDVTVRMQDGERVGMWYILDGVKEGRPSERYLNIIMEGYRNNGFDPKPLNRYQGEEK